ncbi:hypothetical protein F5883DRAFT_568495 [Diaporthe sp. PMI_573]|nr:hypothetical protein F5883DRAFT_568495 [Diaporthaceae sp. PMI_573]
MPINSPELEEVPDSVTVAKDPFVDSIGSVSRQNSLPFWLDRSWIPAESEYPTDDEDGRGLFGIRHSTPQVLVYDWAQKALNIKPLDAYKYPNSAEDEKLLFSKIPFRLWAKPLKLCIERRPKGTSQCAPRYRVTDSKEIPSDMVLLSIIPLDQLNTRLKFGILLRKITWIFIRNFPKTSDTRNISRKV